MFARWQQIRRGWRPVPDRAVVQPSHHETATGTVATHELVLAPDGGLLTSWDQGDRRDALIQQLHASLQEAQTIIAALILASPGGNEVSFTTAFLRDVPADTMLERVDDETTGTVTLKAHLPSRC